MNAFRRILWKECRATWALWVGAGVATVALFVVMRLVSRAPNDALPEMQSLALWIPPLVAMGALSAWFAGEREDRTADWLLALSVPSGPVLAARIGLAWCGLLALQGLLIGAMVAIGAPTWGPNMSFATGDEHWRSYFASVLYLSVAAVAWSLLCSLLCRKPVTAMVAAAVCLVGVETLFAHDQGEVGFATFWQHAEPPMTLGRIALTVVVLAADIVLGDRWLRGQRIHLDALWRWALTDWTLRSWRRRMEATMPWQRALRRLLWLEVRRCSGTIWWLAGSLALMAVVVFWFRNETVPWTILLASLTAIGCGLGSFLGEFTQPGISFWRNRSVASTAIWCVKQSVWLTWMVVWIGLLIGVAAVTQFALHAWVDGNLWKALSDFPTNHRYSIEGYVQLALGVMLTCYAVGQLAMLITRRVVPAVFVSLFGAGFLSAVHAASFGLFIPAWIAIAPIVVWLAVLSAWMWRQCWLDRSNWRGRFLLAGSLAVPPLLVWSISLIYWVESIPDLRPQHAQDIARLQAPLTVHDRQVREELIRTASLIVVPVSPVNGKTALLPHPQLLRLLEIAADDEMTRKSSTELVEPNRDVIAAARELSRQAVTGLALPEEDVFRTKDSPYSRLDNATRQLSALLGLSAMQLTEQGEFDAALDDYLAALRLGQMYARRGWIYRWQAGTMNYAQPVYRGLVEWANHPKQTSARIVAALPRLQAEAANAPPATDALVAGYLVQVAGFDYLGQPDRWYLAQLPGARERHARMQACALDNQLLWYENVERGFWQASQSNRRSGWPEYQHSRAWQVSDDFDYRDEPIGLNNASVTMLWYGRMRLNGTLLVLASIAHRHDHGRTPTDLDDLAGYFPEGVPVDPYTGGYFQYKPRGFPFLANEREELDRLANVPVLWSVGPNETTVRPPREGDKGNMHHRVSGLTSLAFVIPPAADAPDATAQAPRWQELEQLANRTLWKPPN